MTHEEATQRIEKALQVAMDYGTFDGAHHKMWCIDQMVREMTGCPTEKVEGTDSNGVPCTWYQLGKSTEYQEFVDSMDDWDEGVPA